MKLYSIFCFDDEDNDVDECKSLYSFRSGL